MIANEESTEIISFITPGAGGLCQGVTIRSKTSLLLGDGSDKHKKTMMCLLIPIVKTGDIAAFVCH